MSHVVTITTEIRDLESLGLACGRLQLASPEWETVTLFSTTVTGYAVRLRNWRYPVVCDLETGQTHFDNFEGRWGDPSEFDRLKQSYAVEKTRLESRKAGHTVQEELLADGSVKLTLQLAEAG